MLDTLALDLVRNASSGSGHLMSALIRAVPPRSKAECVHLEFKREFNPGAREWAELSKDIVAMANSGGGVILVGVGDDAARYGLIKSLLDDLDAANITDQLRRKAPSASVSTLYLEHSYYRKLYGALIIQPLRVPLVFDTEWGYDDVEGNHRVVLRPGLMYVRTPGRSGPARQADFREVWQRSVDLASETLLARIERVASLPIDSELIVTSGSDAQDGYLLVDSGEGKPVRIVSDPTTPALPIREVLAPDTPYPSVDSEVAGQVRQWQQADSDHRVTRQTLLRWWLQRDQLRIDASAAEFCLLSAVRGHGYPMYWASKLEPGSLRAILERELAAGSAIPCQVYPYVVGVFFWEERAEILKKHVPGLSLAPTRAVNKVLAATSYLEFLTSIRWASRLRHETGPIRVADLVDDRARACAIFAELAQAELDGTSDQSATGFAKQLDLLTHAPN